MSHSKISSLKSPAIAPRMNWPPLSSDSPQKRATITSEMTSSWSIHGTFITFRCSSSVIRSSASKNTWRVMEVMPSSAGQYSRSKASHTVFSSPTNPPFSIRMSLKTNATLSQIHTPMSLPKRPLLCVLPPAETSLKHCRSSKKSSVICAFNEESTYWNLWEISWKINKAIGGW